MLWQKICKSKGFREGVKMRGLTPLWECYRYYEKNAGSEGPNSIWISPKDISSLLRELRESRDSLETDVLYVNNQLKRIEGYKDGAVPIGNVLLTSVGNSLFAITETMEVENYNDMIEIYIASEGISITNAQGYAVENYGEKSIIKKVDENN